MKRYRNYDELTAILTAPLDSDELWTVLRDDVDIKALRATQLVLEEIADLTLLQLIVANNGHVTDMNEFKGAAEYLSDYELKFLIRSEIKYRQETGEQW